MPRPHSTKTPTHPLNKGASFEYRIASVGPGCCTLPGRGCSDLYLLIVGWKGKISVRAYIPRNDRLHHQRLIGADISSFETKKVDEKISLKSVI